MSLYAIGDLHLSLDPSVEKPMDIFGQIWKNHHLTLEKHWKENIGERDTVFLLGDISWGLRLKEAMADLEFIHSLPGKKLIIKGNHDLWWQGVSRLNTLFEDIVFLQNTAYYLREENILIGGSRGWICPGTTGFDTHDRKIFDREVLRLEMSLMAMEELYRKELERGNEAIANAKKVYGIHYPPTNDKHQASRFTDLLSEHNVDLCVYGHLHGEDVYPKGFQGSLNKVNYRLLSCDYIACKPQKLF